MAVSRRTLITPLGTLVALGLPARQTFAQNYPECTVRFIVPFRRVMIARRLTAKIANSIRW